MLRAAFTGWPALATAVAVLAVAPPCAAQKEFDRAVAIVRNARSDRDVETALELLRKAVRKNPGNQQAWDWIVMSLHRLAGRENEAIAASLQSVALGETWQNLYSLGWDLNRVGRLAEAVPYLQRSLALMPGNPMTAAALGRTLHELGRDDEAIPLLERFVRDLGQMGGDKPSEPLTVLMECYAAKGMYAEATVILRQRRAAGIDVEERAGGLLVRRVSRNMPAEQAGIRAGDLLVRWNGMQLAALPVERFEQVVQSATMGQRLPVELTRGGQLQKVELLMGFVVTTVQLPAAPAPAASLRIERVEVRPTPVAAGAQFEVAVEYAVADPAAGTGAIAVEFSFQILSGATVLFTQPPVRTEGPNGSVRRRVERLAAAPRKGSYIFRVSLRYGGSVVEERTGFEVQ